MEENNNGLPFIYIFYTFCITIFTVFLMLLCSLIHNKNKELQKQLDYQTERGIILQIRYENAYYEKTQSYPPYECYPQ